MAIGQGFGPTQRWLRRTFAPLVSPGGVGDPPKSAKSRLQEWSQRQRGTRPMYELLEATGPAHAQEFTVAVVVASDRLGTGRGSSRQRAEEKAAEAAMAVLDERSGNAGARA